MLLVLAEFLAGFSIGMMASLVESSDQQATNRCVADAQSHVNHLRREADERVRRVYGQYGAGMSREVRRAYEQRMGR